MTIRELAVLYALNSMTAAKEHVTAAEITDYIRRGFRYPEQTWLGIDGPLLGLRWKPTKNEVVKVLTDLRGKGRGSFARRQKDQLVYGGGRPTRVYALTPKGVDALCL